MCAACRGEPPNRCSGCSELGGAEPPTAFARPSSALEEGSNPYRPEPVGPYRRRTWLRLLAMVAWVAAAVTVLWQVALRSAGAATPGWLLLALLGLVLVGVPLVVWSWRTRPRDPWVGLRLGQILRRDREANRLLEAERIAEAAALWEQACRDTAALPLNHTLAVYNVGLCELLQRRPERAAELMAAALASGWHATWSLRRGRHVLLGGYAFTLAVLGRAGEARQLQAQAVASCPPARRGVLVSGEALIEAREGDFEALLAAHDGRAASVARAGRTPQQRALHLLRAYALEASGAGADAVEQALAQAPALSAGSVDYLAVRWPELTRFLQAHQLDGPAR